MEDPILKLKELQRNDAVGKTQWEAYTDQHGGGVRDPSKHEADFVWGFLESYGSGVRLEVKNPLVPLFKEGQRRSPAWKRCWEAYCTSQGHKYYDPAKHDQAALSGFINYLGESGEKVLMMTSSGMNWNSLHHDGPPLKRLNTGMGGGSMSTSGNPAKDQLVQAVKNFQRQSEQNKEAWGSFCDSYHGGIRDPMKHDMNTLQTFLMNHGGGGMGGGAGARPSANPQYGAPAAGSGAEGLVARVKAFQRLGPAQREQWGRFADEHLAGKRDPARADPYMLQEFVSSNGL